MAERNEWDVGNGDDEGSFQGVVANARFGFMENYAGGKAPLFMFDLLRPGDGSIIGEADRPRIYSLGQGWTVNNGGTEIAGEYDTISGATGYGKFIARVVKKLGVDMSKRGKSPKVAAVWNGLNLRWKNETYETKEGVEKNRLMPVEFIQEVDLGSYKGRKAAGSKTAVAAAKTDLLKDVKKDLIELVRDINSDTEIPDKDKAREFQKAALRLPAVKERKDAKAYLLDRPAAEKLYKELLEVEQIADELDAEEP